MTARVTSYLELLKAGQFEPAYKDYWKTHPRPVPDAVGLLTLQFQNAGTFVSWSIQGTEYDGSTAHVSVAFVMRNYVQGVGDQDDTVVKKWTWSLRSGEWFFHGDLSAPGF